LAGLAGDSGAEWSLFCPGSGILLDSCSRVMLLLVRPAGASALVAVAGVTTASAAGTDASAELAGGTFGAGIVDGAVVESAAGVDVCAVIGDAGAGSVLLHALSARVTAKRGKSFHGSVQSIEADTWSGDSQREWSLPSPRPAVGQQRDRETGAVWVLSESLSDVM
jgi:hypothetical protein